MNAGRVVCAPAGSEGDLAVLEMPKELVPFGVGGSAVFLAGPQGAAAGKEGAVAGDDFFGVDRLVAHGGVDVAVADDELGDVGWHAVHDASVMKIRRKSCGRNRSGCPVVSVRPVLTSAALSSRRTAGGLMGRRSPP